MTTPADIQAAIDVLADLSAEASEGLPLEVAISLRDILGQLHSQVRVTANQVDTAITTQLEQPQIVNGIKYEAKYHGTMRYHHDEVGRLAIDQIRDDLRNPETGEIPDMAPAVLAWRAFSTLYLTASVEPKRRSLLALFGIDDVFKAHLAKWTKTGTKIVETKLEEEL